MRRCPRSHRPRWRILQFEPAGRRFLLACLECRRTWRARARLFSGLRYITPAEEQEFRKPRLLDQSQDT